MKYQIGQSVLLLDTEFKPALNAVIKDYNTESGKYLIEFQYPGHSAPEQFWVPQERLQTATDFIRDIQ